MEVDWLFAFTAKSTFGSSAPIIFDTGASLAISPKRGDFVNEPTPLNRPTTLGGMANDLEIKGIGTVVWTFDANDGTEIQIRTQTYWVPGAKSRLLRPQKLYNKKQGVFGHYQGNEDIFCLYFLILDRQSKYTLI
jgi:hypothetical protein